MDGEIFDIIKIDFSLEEKIKIEALVVALDKMSNSTQEMLNNNKKELQVIFNDLYTNDRALLFKIFQVDEIGNSVLDFSQQKILFDSIFGNPKEKLVQEIYNKSLGVEF